MSDFFQPDPEVRKGVLYTFASAENKRQGFEAAIIYFAHYSCTA